MYFLCFNGYITGFLLIQLSFGFQIFTALSLRKYLWIRFSISLWCSILQYMYLLKQNGGATEKGSVTASRVTDFLGIRVYSVAERTVVLAKSVYQHGIADLCLGTVNSNCGRELSRHVLKYWLHRLHSSPWQPWPFFSPQCNDLEYYALSRGCLSNSGGYREMLLDVCRKW